MKKILIFLAAFLTLPLPEPLYAQDIETVLQQIEQNNTTLKALGGQAEADKSALRTGISLPGPAVEWGRLWGDPATIGNRTDIAVSQEFDIATITGMRSRQAKRQGVLIDMQLALERINILLEAKQYCIETIYCNRLAQELSVRLQHALTIADGYARKLESGEVNRIEYNKAQLNLSAVRGEVARNGAERAALLAELRRLNGGEEVRLDATEFPSAALPADFESWYAQAEQRSPLLEYTRRGTEAARKQLSLARTEWLPTFSVGYLREQTLGQHYQGITLGISVPLWANRSNVEQARVAATASQVREQDSRLQFHEQLRTLYRRASGLGAVAVGIRQALAEADNSELLEKALAAGEISLLEYMVEMGFYYDAADRALEAERDFQLACARLSAVEL